MKKYLRVPYKSLFVQYGSLYVALFFFFLFSNDFIGLKWLSIIYLPIATILFTLDRFGTYMLLTNEGVLHQFSYLVRFLYPANMIVKVKLSVAEGILGRPQSLTIEYLSPKGTVQRSDYVLYRYDRADIVEFVNALEKKFPKIPIDDSIRALE